MPDDDELHALYRYRGKRKKPPLYIGRTNNPMRRAGEHQAKQPWISETVRIDVRWYYADEIAEVERRAIQREHPVYNIKHNRGRVYVEVDAEVTIRESSGEGLFFMAALVVAGGMGAAWAADSLANWNVRRRAVRAGQQIELPPARNLFNEPDHWSFKLLAGLISAAAPSPEEKKMRVETAALMMSATRPPRVDSLHDSTTRTTDVDSGRSTDSVELTRRSVSNSPAPAWP